MRKKLLSFFAGLVFTSGALMAQKISDTYQFVYSTGTFTDISGGTVLDFSVIGPKNSDDGYVNSIPIGFTFNYGGTNYTTVNAGANGLVTFGAALPTSGYPDTWTNNLTSFSLSRPVLAPLWDDLYTDPGTVSYITTGTAPNRTFTIEYNSIYWTGAANNPVMSFQVVLHETSNVIDFIYRSESDAYGDDGTHGASIGISGASSGDFLSVTPNGILTSATSATENKTITTKLATGTTYSFIPYCSAGIQPTYIGNSESIGRVRIGTIDQTTPALPSTAYHNYTNLYTFAQANASIPITINTNYTYSLDQLYIWIDFNHNGDFTDPGEEVFMTSLPLTSSTITTNIAIPDFSSSVLSGPTRMRIRLNDTGSPPDNTAPCGSGGLFGDVQDFTINIQQCISVIVVAQPPASKSVCDGSNVTISGLNAIGSGILFTWQESPDGGTTWNNLSNSATYSGTTTNTLSITGVTAAKDGYKYRCIMTGSCTPAYVSSNVTTLAISSPASVNSQPTGQSVCQGSDANFSVSASGTSPSYQWQVSTDGGATYNSVPAATTEGGTSNSLTVHGVTAAMSGYRYRCVVTVASCGSVNSNAATLTVDANPAPALSVSASATQLKPGSLSTVSTSPSVAGVTYSWNFNGSALAGATTSSLTVDASGTGTYMAFITDAAGCTYPSTNSVTITAIPTDKLYIYPNPAQGGQFTVQYYSPWLYDVRTLTIYNAAGVVVARKDFEITAPYVKMNFNLGAAGPGVYTVKINHRYVQHQPTSEVVGRVVIQ
jgi:hypothetical protein